MGFRLFIFLLSFLPVAALSQVVEMKDGKVYKDDKLYCLYKETGKRISTMTIEAPGGVATPLLYPEACGDEFKDYTFGGQYQKFITARARVLASAHEPNLVYHYSIYFEGINWELNLRYHMLLIRTLAQDIVKFDVIQNGFLNEKNAQKLVDKWENKSAVLSRQQLAQGIVNNYNSANDREKEKSSSINIKIEGDKIYKDGLPFGKYILDKHLGGGNLFGSMTDRNFYKIEDPQGNLLGWVIVPMLRSSFFLLPAGEKESLAVVTTDRDEQKIIASASKVLIVHKSAHKQ